MHNHQKHDVTGPLKALLRDLQWNLPCDIMDAVGLDIDTIGDLSRHHGHRITMVDLPKLGKLFDHALTTGFFPWSEYPTLLRYSKKARTDAVGVLSRLIGLTFRSAPSGAIIDEPDPMLVRSTRAFLFLFKKVREDCPDNVVRRSHHEFFELDAALRPPFLDWNWTGEGESPSFASFPSFAGDSHSDPHLDKLCGLLDLLSWYIVPRDEVLIDDVIGKHGPGRVSDLKKGQDKYLFPTWGKRLSRCFPPALMISHWGEIEQEFPDHWGGEPWAKLIAVPKTLDKPRLIASEPTANQWCQQSILQWIRRHMTTVANMVIDFHSQEPSKQAALEASKANSGIATVDLSSASDRLSCWTVERFFRSNPSLLEYLWSSRTAVVKSELIGKSALMHKFGAQGAATTFAVQSLVYAGCALAATLYARGFGGKFRPTMADITSATVDVRVFGDDIIVPEESLAYLWILLNHLQLKVNMDKTHHVGVFRESCGMDAFAGEEVTPLYLADVSPKVSSPTGVASWVCVSNNAHQMGYWNLSEWMMNQLPKGWLSKTVISRHIQPGVSFFTYTNGTFTSAKSRWNKDLQRTEHKVIAVKVRVSVKGRAGWSNLTQFFTENPGTPDYLEYLDRRLRAGLGFVDHHRVKVTTRWESLTL